jgi:prepilin-type N-terminal cleavage/methylation domain-containing protein
MSAPVTTTRTGHRDAGFSLVEMLIVVVVLGILAAVTVFAVRGITDRGTENARLTDRRTLESAQEAHMAAHGTYATEADLVTNGLLRSASALHDVDLAPDAMSYTITPAPAPSPTTT